ncbi:MAG: hypothetical protein OXD45_01745 [Rhodobacteraceae bacterium]|nr:hypothetical protein [Paracoccaceae bacterium]
MEFVEGGDQIPPNWFVYLSLANMDESQAKVNSNGGAVMKEPFHVDNMGAIAIVVNTVKAVVRAIALELQDGFSCNKHTH